MRSVDAGDIAVERWGWVGTGMLWNLNLDINRSILSLPVFFLTISETSFPVTLNDNFNGAGAVVAVFI